MDDRLMYRRELYIGGRWVEPAGTDTLPVVSPSTEAVVGQVPLATDADIDRAVGEARTAFEDGPWPRMAPGERADVLAQAADLLRKRSADIAGVTVDEMGVAVSQATASQTGLVAPVFAHYADLIRTFEFERRVVTADRAGLVTNEPVGVVAAIVPWNAPVTLSAWKVAPALAAGCTVVVKPPPEAPLSNFVLAEVLDEAGVPAGVVNVVPGGREVGEHLVTHPGTDKVAFTGSTAAGKRIMSLCSERVARVSLELGGKSASVLLDDADLAAVVPRVVGAGMHLSGQVCGAHTRVLVPRSRYDEALDAAAAAAEAVPYGDPHDPTTVVGPLVAERQRERVEGYIGLAVDAGARVVAGGVAARPPAEGLVRAADGPRRRRQHDAGGPRGDLRAGPVLHPLRRRRGRRPHRQRLAVRPVGRRVERRRRACAGRGPPAAHRQRGRQRLVPAVPAGPLRRVQAVGARPRAGPRGPGRLPRAPQHRPSALAGLTAPVTAAHPGGRVGQPRQGSDRGPAHPRHRLFLVDEGRSEAYK